MSTIDKIFELLEMSGRDQKDLTDFLGINKGVATQWKSGKSRSYYKYIDKIAEFLNTTPSDLLNYSTIQVREVKYDRMMNIDSETLPVYKTVEFECTVPDKASAQKKSTAENAVDRLMKLMKDLTSDFSDAEIREIQEYVRYLRWKRMHPAEVNA